MAALGLALTLIVRLYDNTALPEHDRAAAIAVASEILLASSIPTSWPDCQPPNPKPKIAGAFVCERPLGPGEVAVRLVREPSRQVEHQLITRPSSLATAHDLPLGYSLVDVKQGGGALATIYLDRVERIAADGGVDAGVILGRAIAHEIGHLLLGTTQHGQTGLMRAIWSRQTLEQNRPHDWLFTARESTGMRRALARRLPVAQTAENIVWGTK